jgi:hypothetical protein
MHKTALLCALILLGALTAPARAQQQTGKLIDCHAANVIPGTTPQSCDVSPSRVEYQGTDNDGQITLSCLWALQGSVPIADGRYYLTHAIMPRTGSEQITLRVDDKIVAILAQGNGPVQTEVLTPNGVVAKNCASLDIANFTATGCGPAQPAISPQLVAGTDAAMTQDCGNYVHAMAMGGSINARYFDAAAAMARLNAARGFADWLSR